MIPFALNPNRLALALRLPAPSIYETVKEERGIAPEMALRLARFFGTTPEFWLNLQTHYDLSVQIVRQKTRSTGMFTRRKYWRERQVFSDSSFDCVVD